MGSYVSPEYWKPEQWAKQRKKLRDLREKAGLTQVQLSELLGYHGHNAVADFEQGRRVPPTRIFWEWPRLCGKTWILVDLVPEPGSSVVDRPGIPVVESSGLNFPVDDAPELLAGCPVEVWDGPYQFRCGRGVDRCAQHGPFVRALRCRKRASCPRPDAHPGACERPRSF